jgi:hypothetical protein
MGVSPSTSWSAMAFAQDAALAEQPAVTLFTRTSANTRNAAASLSAAADTASDEYRARFPVFDVVKSDMLAPRSRRRP